MLKLKEKRGDGRSVSLCKKQVGREALQGSFSCAGRSGGTVSEGHPSSHHNAVLWHWGGLQTCTGGMQLPPACLLMLFMCQRRSRRSRLPGLCPNIHIRNASRLASNSDPLPLLSPRLSQLFCMISPTNLKLKCQLSPSMLSWQPKMNQSAP